MAHVIINNMLKGGSIYSTGIGRQMTNETLRNLIDTEGELYRYAPWLEKIMGVENVNNAKAILTEAFEVHKNKSWNIDMAMKLYDMTVKFYEYESNWNMRVENPDVNPRCFTGKTITEYMYILFEFCAQHIFSLRINDEYSGEFKEVWQGSWCADDNDKAGRNDNIIYKTKKLVK